MPIVKIEVKKRTHPYVMIDKRPLNDHRLSWGGKGLLANLLCRPRDWRLIVTNLLKQSPDGRYVLRRLLSELKRFGYAKMQRIRDAQGKMAGSTWFIYEEPDFPATETLLCPPSVKSDPRRNPTLGKIRVSEKSVTTNSEYPDNPTKKDKTSKSVLAPDGERKLLDQIGEILGDAEMKKNGGLWRTRIRGGPAERRALRNTIEDFKLRMANQRDPIRKRPAWFTNQYQRNLLEVDAGPGGPAKTAET